MRASLHICVAFTAFLWLAVCFAPVGLNICVQDSGQTEIGLGCSCDTCETATPELAAGCGSSCCDKADSGEAVQSKCCTCTRLVLLASALQTKPEKPQFASAPSALVQFADPYSTSQTGYTVVRQSLANPPPLLHRTTVLQI